MEHSLTNAAPSRLGHVPQLDGLRGIAIGTVVLYHMGLPPFTTGGYIGVEVFFVLSGFLITTLLLAEHEQSGQISLKDFYARRILRLGPALLLVAATVAAGAAVLPDERGHMLRAVPTSIFYIANWVKAFGWWSFEPMHHTWSLAIEEQFYLIWPPLLIAIFKMFPDRRRQAWAVAGLAAFFLAERFTLVLADVSVSRVYHGTDTRAVGLLVGCLLAFARTLGWRILHYLSHPIVGLLSIAGVLAAGVALPYDMPYVSVGLLVVDALTCGLILAALRARGLVGSVLALRPLVGLGVVSYGVYLWHDVIQRAVRPDISRGAMLTIQFALIAIFVAISWRFVETPALRLKRYFERKPPADALLDPGGER